MSQASTVLDPDGETSGVLEPVQTASPTVSPMEAPFGIASAETRGELFDISDVTGVRRIASLILKTRTTPMAFLPIVSDLSIPVEQWLPNIPYGEVFDFNTDIDQSSALAKPERRNCSNPTTRR